MQKLHRLVFATGMIGLGALTLVYGDFALQWQPVPAWVPAREYLAYASGALVLACGITLAFSRTAAAASRVLLAYVLFWVLLLKVPRAVAAPLVEASWLGLGEISVVLAGAVALFASLTARGDARPRAARGNGLRIARYLFAVALFPIGLSHMVYAAQTAGLVPAWLPYRRGWAYLTGVGHIAAGLGVLFGVLPRLAAALEAAMLTVFTLLVWVPAAAAAPGVRLPWTALVVSWAITGGAWAVAGSMMEASTIETSV